MNNYSMTYSQFGCCGNHQISANYVVDKLVMCENRVHTHTHTHTFSSRVFYRKYLNYQRVGKVLFSGFAISGNGSDSDDSEFGPYNY